MTALVPPKVAAVCATVGALVVSASAIVPAAWTVPVLLVGALALFLGGQALPQLSFAEGKPIVPIAAVPILGSISAALVQFATTMPDGSSLRSVLILVAGLLAFLAGKSMPAPQIAAAEAKGQKAVDALDSKAAKLEVISGGSDEPKP